MGKKIQDSFLLSQSRSGKENPCFMKKKGNKLTTIILILILLIGLSLLLYPSVSDYWNSFTQSKAIASYAEEVANLDEEKYRMLWEEAVDYNEKLHTLDKRYILDDERKAEYESCLNLSGNGIMGYIEVPSIGVTLPMYHGTAESVLQIAIGHIEWTDLPVGGEGTHCALSGHRGLPSAKLFSDLDKLVAGDIFILRVLDEILTYEVDRILIVEPDDMDHIEVIEGEDFCTLITCTPYGVNSHRLLVRGHRIENIEEAKVARVTADAIQIEPLIVAPIVAIPMLLVLLIALLIPKKKNKKNGGSTEDD